jgi:hypothetical protein
MQTWPSDYLTWDTAHFGQETVRMLSAPEEIKDQVVLALVFGRTTVGTHETRFSSINISDHQKYGRRLKVETLTTLSTSTLHATLEPPNS